MQGLRPSAQRKNIRLRCGTFCLSSKTGHRFCQTFGRRKLISKALEFKRCQCPLSSQSPQGMHVYQDRIKAQGRAWAAWHLPSPDLYISTGRREGGSPGNSPTSKADITVCLAAPGSNLKWPFLSAHVHRQDSCPTQLPPSFPGHTSSFTL